MQAKKIVPAGLLLSLMLCTSSLAFCQTEALKSVVNSLALYNQKKDLKFLSNAKKSIDSLIKVSPDSLDLERNVYRALVNSNILYADSLNKLNFPPALFKQTITLVNNLADKRKIYRYEGQITFAKQCLANVYIRKAFVYLSKTDFVNALNLFEDAQNYVPAYKPLIGWIAYCNSKLGNLNSAARNYSELINSGYVKPGYIETTSNLYKALGDTAMALNVVLKGRKLLPDEKSILLDEANIYTNKRDYRSLYPLLPALIDNYTNNPDIAFIAACCYDHLNQYNKAETFYLKAIDLNNSAYEPIFNLGLLFLKKSEISGQGSAQDVLQARQWLEKANEISPNDIKCLKVLEVVYAKTGNKEQVNSISNKIKQLTNQ